MLACPRGMRAEVQGRGRMRVALGAEIMGYLGVPQPTRRGGGTPGLWGARLWGARSSILAARPQRILTSLDSSFESARRVWSTRGQRSKNCCLPVSQTPSPISTCVSFLQCRVGHGMYTRLGRTRQGGAEEHAFSFALAFFDLRCCVAYYAQSSGLWPSACDAFHVRRALCGACLLLLVYARVCDP